jgi:hypothetical protein
MNAQNIILVWLNMGVVGVYFMQQRNFQSGGQHG